MKTILSIFMGTALILVLSISGYAYSIGGEYDCFGYNPDGSTYTGTVYITKEGNTYYFEWEVGTYYEGEGELYSNILAVDWGSDAPVYYVVLDDGTLAGLWAGGQASEILTPVNRR